MLRLTLRTLLAYLDDTLEPAQTKQIGAKVAESDEAKETIERIKTVTRRRRLTALPVDTPDETSDPNTIAEYLDSTLPNDQLVEVEQTALDNDTMLAELAACHQILTLVLGEPAKVPATAQRRMYRLVKGPESIPYRKPTADTPVAGVAPPESTDEPSDDEILGTILGPRKVFWILSSLALVVLLGIAIWLAIPNAPSIANQGYVYLPYTTPVVVNKPTPNLPKPPVVVDKKEPPSTVVVPELGPMPRLVVPVELPPVPKQPDEQRDGFASLDAESEPLLIRKRETAKWERAALMKLNTTDTALALPGFHPVFTTDTGVRIQLWGNMSEFLNVPYTEVSLTPYIPPLGIDAEFTLHSGRVFISAPKATKPTVVRVRFLEEVWDITLTNNMTEIAIDRLGEPVALEPFQAVGELPRVLVYVGVLSGSMTIRDGPHLSGPWNEGTKIKFDNKAGRAGPAPKVDPDEAALVNRWAKELPNTRDANQMTEAVKVMRELVSKSGSLEVDFEAIAKDAQERLPRRILCAHMLGSVDSLSYLIDATEFEPAAVREAAVRATVQWVSQGSGRLDEFTRALNAKATYTDEQRVAILALVQSSSRPSPDNAEKVFALLKSDKLAVREFAKVFLLQFDPSGAKDWGYDAGVATEIRGPRANNWLAAWKRKEMKAKE